MMFVRSGRIFHFLLVTAFLNQAFYGKVVSVEEIKIKLPHLLELQDTTSIHSLLSNHRSRLFPSYACTSVESCFGEEISELKTALLENAGESDDAPVVANKEGMQASTFNAALRSAVQSIYKQTGIFGTGKKTAKRLVRATDYFIGAFFLLRSRLREFRQSDKQRHAILDLMKSLFEHAAEIASQRKYSGREYDKFDWLADVPE